MPPCHSCSSRRRFNRYSHELKHRSIRTRQSPEWSIIRTSHSRELDNERIEIPSACQPAKYRTHERERETGSRSQFTFLANEARVPTPMGMSDERALSKKTSLPFVRSASSRSVRNMIARLRQACLLRALFFHLPCSTHYPSIRFLLRRRFSSGHVRSGAHVCLTAPLRCSFQRVDKKRAPESDLKSHSNQPALVVAREGGG